MPVPIGPAGSSQKLSAPETTAEGCPMDGYPVDLGWQLLASRSYLVDLPAAEGAIGICQGPTVQRIVDSLTPGLSHALQGLLLMVQTATEPQVKFHRLRTSVPAKLWRWREAKGGAYKRA